MKNNTKHLRSELPILGGLAAFAFLLVMPTTIAAMIPCRVTPLQNSAMTSDGKLAEAAILNAQPTK